VYDLGLNPCLALTCQASSGTARCLSTALQGGVLSDRVHCPRRRCRGAAAGYGEERLQAGAGGVRRVRKLTAAGARETVERSVRCADVRDRCLDRRRAYGSSCR
jgi:hypothetical protein